MVRPRRKPVVRPRPKKRPAKPIPIGDEVPETFAGVPGVLLATGPSLNREDIEYIRPLHAAGKIAVFGLNDAYRICDFLDVLYFCDPRWLASNLDVLDYKSGQLWSQDVNVRSKHAGRIHRVAGSSGSGLSKLKNHIHFGGNSGLQLLNLVWHFGVREFYLLGYNMGKSGRGSKKQHFFGPHPKPLNQSDNYKSFVSAFRAIDKETRAMVTNCTYPTGLDGVFEQMPLKEALPHNEKIRHVRLEEPAQETRSATRPSKAPAKVETVPRNTRRRNLQEPDSGDHCDRIIPVAIATRSDPVPTYGG